MSTLEVASSFAVLRILPRAMLNVILRSVFDLLLMNSNSAVAMHTSNIRRRCTEELGNGRNCPPRNLLAINKKEFLLLTLNHQVVRHNSSLDAICVLEMCLSN